MTTIDSLYQRILDDPSDDGARLVYADAIEETDPERAEFIRVQIELANGADMNPNFVARNNELSANCFDWFEMPVGMAPGSISWRRGFPYSVTLTLAAFLGGECVCDSQPIEITTANSMGRREFMTCPSCHGTGRTPGLAKELAKWPIERVTLSDREPNSNQWGTQFWWVLLGIANAPNYSLPDVLWGKMCYGKRFNRMANIYDYRESALSALSDACVRMIREARK